MKIAIIGSGISGLTCAYYLTKAKHQVTVYEAKEYIGGHTHTVDAHYQGESARIDTGFIVFNDRTYPNFIKLMTEIGVESQATEMSFSVRNDHLDLEYNGNNLATLFAQPRNLIRPSFLKMLKDIAYFNKDVRLVSQENAHLTIGEYLQKSSYSSLFQENYLLPMISAIWSMGLTSCRDFPLHFFVRFFDNHGLLDITNRPQWYTIVGGSSSYIAPLTASFKNNFKLGHRVVSVQLRELDVLVHTMQERHPYDQVILACHGDQALKLLQEPSATEKSVLSNFCFSHNKVDLHVDSRQLPKRKKAWASWNYRVVDSAKEQTALTYNMNILQRLDKKHTYLVSLNQDIDPQYVLSSYSYKHPIYNPDMIGAQQRWQHISGLHRIHYCGAYWFNGFHEDGVKSGLRVCKTVEESI